jgi:CRP/FNR family transcriptional regulator
MHGGADDLDGLFLVKKGQARAFIVSESGKEITLYRLLERDMCIFSASCMLRDISFDILVEAEKETEAFLIPSAVYQELMQSSLSVSDYTNRLMSSRFSDVMWVMEQVLFMSFDKRLALFLLEQSNIEGSNRLIITHENIARHMGTAREVVTRMLKYFAAEGMVELFRGGVILKNPEKLRKV